MYLYIYIKQKKTVSNLKNILVVFHNLKCVQRKHFTKVFHCCDWMISSMT